MPIYEYSCPHCGKRSSALLKSFADPDPACPHCNTAGLQRLISTFATVRSEGGDVGDDDFGAGGDDFGGGGDADFGGGGDWDGDDDY